MALVAEPETRGHAAQCQLGVRKQLAGGLDPKLTHVTSDRRTEVAPKSLRQPRGTDARGGGDLGKREPVGIVHPDVLFRVLHP